MLLTISYFESKYTVNIIRDTLAIDTDTLNFRHLESLNCLTNPRRKDTMRACIPP